MYSSPSAPSGLIESLRGLGVGGAAVFLRNVANPDYFEPWNHDESNPDTDEDSRSEEDVADPTAASAAASNSE
jgi:hypothetical protein